MRAGMRRAGAVLAAAVTVVLLAAPAFAAVPPAGGAPPVHDGWNYKGVIALILGAPALVFAVVFFWYHAGRERHEGETRAPHA